VVALSAITAALRPKSILEIGTHDGFSGWHLWANSQAEILTIDLPRQVRPYLPLDPRIRVLEVDSRQWEPTPSNQFDLCFIDAGHDYGCVRNDSEKALRCLRPRGTVLWHDAAWRRYGFGVNRYLRELRTSGKDVRMLRAGFYDYCGLAILREGVL
jgi:predicted O-methyltransferase YrrM